jgi:L-aminopeptidase/D-esterase-like protein
VVGALIVANPFGDVIDPITGEVLAGARNPHSDEPADTLAVMRDMASTDGNHPGTDLRFASNTVIGAVAANCSLTKEEANKVAQMAQDGVARAIRPAHTMFDGDTLFALATGQKHADVNLIGAYAAEAVAQAVVRAVRAAERAGGLPAYRDLRTEAGF